MSEYSMLIVDTPTRLAPWSACPHLLNPLQRHWAWTL